MNAIDLRFDQLKSKNRKALIPFIMAGDPDLSSTARLLLCLQDAQADLIEIGIPFSDPLADGPVIQQASMRALSRGTTPQKVLDVVASVRHRIHIPVICLSYWNPIIQFGSPIVGRPTEGCTPVVFIRAAQRSGISGLIVPDLPIEEGGMFHQVASAHELATIFLAAPTSSSERLRSIAQMSEGFIYYVSVTGTTGARRQLPESLLSGVRNLKRLSSKPVCVGFGVSTAAQARTVSEVADGVIVGSALLQAMGQARNRQDIYSAAFRFIHRLRTAL